MRRFVLGLALPLLLLCGCENGRTVATKPAQKPKQSRWAKGSEAAAKEKAKGGNYVADPRRTKAVPRAGAEIRSGYSGSPEGGGYGRSGSAFHTLSEKQAIDQIGKSVRESLDLGPTLVVWMFDRSDSASKLVTASVTSIHTLYGTDDLTAAGQDGKLLTTVVGFGEKTDFLLDPPVSDVAQVKEAFDAVKSEAGSREETFAALKLTLEKYLPLRTKDRREVLIAILTDEPGDDLKVLDDVVAITQKNAIPVFVVGPSAPLGNATPPPPPAGSSPPPKSSDTRTFAADAYYGDWVSFKSIGFGSENFDSGFGPWPLERLCRESSGAYLAVGSTGSTYAARVDPAVMKKFAPDYLPLAAMEKLLSENKCRRALVEAAKLPPSVSGMLNPQTGFPKRNEAEMKRMLDKAQLDAAKLEPEVNKIYDALSGDNSSVEGDRARLTGTRWQVAYDTALGRAAAAKVRVDGYNAMLAALKRGKAFENASSTTWILEPADTIETGSALQKLADKAKSNLERVQKEYPNTPWARIAEQELKTPLGWKWREQ